MEHISRRGYMFSKTLVLIGRLWVFLSATQCHSMQLSDNPISTRKPEAYFLTDTALTLAQAIRTDDIAKIDAIFRQHPTLDPNLEGKQGVTFLFWAYAHHHVKAMRALAAHKADVNRPLHLPNAQGGVDATHLINIAAEGPKDELLLTLLDLGADPNARDERKEPALHNALYAHQYQRMKLLLDRGADINITNSAGATPAVVLARLNYFELVHYLLERGADWRKTDGEVALWTQENDTGNAEAIQWQKKVKQLLIRQGVKFPVPSPGARRYATIRERWEQTPEGRAWREKLDALGAQPEVVGKPWVEQEDAARTAMKAWMKQQGIPEPPLIMPSPKGNK